MKTRTLGFACTTLLLISAAASAAGLASSAGDVGFHPATRHGERPAVDAASQVYGHPASPLNQAPGHANAEHPAVVVAHHAGDTFDPSTLMLGHPASPRNGPSVDTLQVSAVAR